MFPLRRVSVLVWKWSFTCKTGVGGVHVQFSFHLFLRHAVKRLRPSWADVTENDEHLLVISVHGFYSFMIMNHQLTLFFPFSLVLILLAKSVHPLMLLEQTS